MYRDATNLFQAKFTVTMDFDFSKAFDFFDNWYVSVQEKLQTDRLVETYHEIEVSEKKNIHIIISFDGDKISWKKCLVYLFLGITTSIRLWCH